MEVRLEGITKSFGDFTAVNNLNVTIEDGTLAGLLGPSGCGKSTTLYMIAGLEKPTSGRIYFGDEDVTDLPAEKRGIGLVFQNYALYPHMTVRQNIMFPLENAKVPKAEALKIAQEMADLVQIGHLMDRKPGELSGGQQQRVAIARAIAKKPRVLLLDEPLSNLDAKLRQQMRVEIINLYNKLDIPFIYVTHDQVEAMSMGTRIVIMRNGVIQQVDSPTNLYDFPVNRFVAGFLGTPQMNFVEVIIKKTNDTTLNIKFNEEYNLDVDLKQLRPIQEQYLDGEEHQVIFGIRSEDVSIVKEGGFAMKIILTEVLGSETLAHTESLNKVPFKLVIKSADRLLNNMGEVICAEINKSKIHLFTSDEKETSIFKKEE